MKENPAPLEIPHYISSFELEEARLGQATQKIQIEHNAVPDPDLIKKTLRKIRIESVNAEFALDFAARELIESLIMSEDPSSQKRARDIRELASRLLHLLLKK